MSIEKHKLFLIKELEKTLSWESECKNAEEFNERIRYIMEELKKTIIDK